MRGPIDRDADCRVALGAEETLAKEVGDVVGLTREDGWGTGGSRITTGLGDGLEEREGLLSDETMGVGVAKDEMEEVARFEVDEEGEGDTAEGKGLADIEEAGVGELERVLVREIVDEAEGSGGRKRKVTLPGT